MKLLWVKAGKLLPVDTGGKIRTFNLLRHLRGRADVTVLSCYIGGRDAAYERDLVETFPGAVPVHVDAPDTGAIRKGLDYARRVWLPAPYAVALYSAGPARQFIARADADRRFDVLLCDFLAPSLNFPRRARTPAVLFQHNVESILWRRQAAAERNPVRRAVFGLEALKMDRYERKMVQRFDHVIAVSEQDKAAMAEMTRADRITVVPTGVDTKAFRPAVRNERPEPIVLFLGSMDWEANIDGVRYFHDEIWPAVRAAFPAARFQIVGRSPAPAVRRLASDCVEVVGTVPSVVEYLHRAAVVVVPLRIGGGTRLKIYEAMGAGKAVVSTTIGAEGLDCHDGRDILIADTPPAFAARVVEVLQDAAARRRLEDAALALASRFDWSGIADTFAGVLEDVVRGAVTRTPSPDQAAA